MKQITVKAKIAHTTEEERVINLPYYGKSKDGMFIAVYAEKAAIEIYPDELHYTLIQEIRFSNIPSRITGTTEITKEEFDARFSESIMKIGAAADKYITVPEWNLSDPEPNTSMIESLETADELPTF
jgi:hypothetical protein